MAALCGPDIFLVAVSWQIEGKGCVIPFPYVKKLPSRQALGNFSITAAIFRPRTRPFRIDILFLCRVISIHDNDCCDRGTPVAASRFPTLILFPVLAFATDYNRHHCLPNGRIPLTVSGKFAGSGSGEIT